MHLLMHFPTCSTFSISITNKQPALVFILKIALLIVKYHMHYTYIICALLCIDKRTKKQTRGENKKNVEWRMIALS